MVQIIYDTVAGSFLMITDRGSSFGKMGSFFREVVVKPKSSSFSSYWAANGEAIKAKFSKIIEMYQNPSVNFGG